MQTLLFLKYVLLTLLRRVSIFVIYKNYDTGARIKEYEGLLSCYRKMQVRWAIDSLVKAQSFKHE